MNDNPFFTLILPVYKVESYLLRCVNSIENNLFDDYEIILVDDGSPDGSPKICDDLAEKNEKIKVIHKKNEGLGLARNSGLSIAKGKYIWFVDSDDSISENSLTEIRKTIEINNYPDVVFFGHRRINSRNKIEYEELHQSSKKYYYNKEDIINNLLPDFIFNDPLNKSNKKMSSSAWCCCINRDIMKKYNMKFVSERIYISEDYYFWIENFINFNSICFMDNICYNYHQNEDSLTMKYMKDRYDKNVVLLKKLIELIKEKSYSDECITRVYGLFISNIFGTLKSEVKNFKSNGILKSYNSFVNICKDTEIKKAINIYNCNNMGLGWRIFADCIKHNNYILLYILLFIR